MVPRYFEGLAGGAETLLGLLAAKLSARGDDVTLLCTCAKDNRTWENEFEAGETRIHSLRVLRFPVDQRDLERWIPIQVAIHEGKSVSYEDQLTWIQESVNSRALYQYIANHGPSYDAIFFGPYLFGTTFWGSQIYPEKSVLVPCLHDEPYAYLDVIASMFRRVKGCLFNAAPEMHLARSLYGEVRGGVVGMGFDRAEDQEVPTMEPYLPVENPYILYLGRKEMGKNVHRLIDYFCEAKDRGLLPEAVRLAILGGGSFADLHREEVLRRGDVIDLPHVSELDKQRLLQHALFLCQPSQNESFSIVLMEAWLAGAPVVVHGECAVTKSHVLESAGGLYISSATDLAGVTRYMLENPAERLRLAENGRRYVVEHYSWQATLERFDSVMRDLAPSSIEIAHQVDHAWTDV